MPLLKKKLGWSDVEVSAVCFGTMTFGYDAFFCLLDDRRETDPFPDEGFVFLISQFCDFGLVHGVIL